MLFKTKDTIYIESLLRISNPYHKTNGWSLCYYFNNPQTNPLKSDIELENMRIVLWSKYANKNTKPLENAYNFLYSSNLLFKGLNNHTYIPCTTLSSFACELFIKFWIMDDINIYKPIKNTKSKWVFYQGSNSKEHFNTKKIKGSSMHNLFKIYKSLPEDLQLFHEKIYNHLYLYEIGECLEDSLSKVSEYFFQARYIHENIKNKYDVYLCNKLANFFHDVFITFNNWDGKIHHV